MKILFILLFMSVISCQVYNAQTSNSQLNDQLKAIELDIANISSRGDILNAINKLNNIIQTADSITPEQLENITNVINNLRGSLRNIENGNDDTEDDIDRLEDDLDDIEQRLNNLNVQEFNIDIYRIKQSVVQLILYEIHIVSTGKKLNDSNKNGFRILADDGSEIASINKASFLDNPQANHRVNINIPSGKALQGYTGSISLVYTYVGTGSGFYTSSNEIATNYHVIHNNLSDYNPSNNQKLADPIIIIKDDENTTYITDLVWADPMSDLALVRVNSSGEPLEIESDHNVKILDEVTAIGSPLSVSNFHNTASSGNISNIGCYGGQFVSARFCTTAPVISGNSGGPLILHKTSKVAGINTSIQISRVRIGTSDEYGILPASNLFIAVTGDVLTKNIELGSSASIYNFRNPTRLSIEIILDGYQSFLQDRLERQTREAKKQERQERQAKREKREAKRQAREERRAKRQAKREARKQNEQNEQNEQN